MEKIGKYRAIDINAMEALFFDEIGEHRLTRADLEKRIVAIIKDGGEMDEEIKALHSMINDMEEPVLWLATLSPEQANGDGYEAEDKEEMLIKSEEEKDAIKALGYNIIVGKRW